MIRDLPRIAVTVATGVAWVLGCALAAAATAATLVGAFVAVVLSITWMGHRWGPAFGFGTFIAWVIFVALMVCTVAFGIDKRPQKVEAVSTVQTLTPSYVDPFAEYYGRGGEYDPETHEFTPPVPYPYPGTRGRA